MGSAPATETILVVDDEPHVRTLVSAILKRLGYNVLVAQDGQDALRISRKHAGPIHLVLTDLLMAPGMSGLETATRLATQRPGTPVLYMSDSGIMKTAFKEQPELQFIDKPFSAEALVRKVRALLHPAG